MKKINLMFLFLVLISNYIISQDTKLEYSEATGELSLTNIPKPMNSTNLKKKPCWNIHWELGDGYSFFEDGVCGSSHTIKHFYRRKGIFKITVFFTPIYALGTHEPISITVQIRNVRKKVKEENRYTRQENSQYYFQCKQRKLLPGTPQELPFSIKMMLKKTQVAL